jgi:hypothetical protein
MRLCADASLFTARCCSRAKTKPLRGLTSWLPKRPSRSLFPPTPGCCRCSATMANNVIVTSGDAAGQILVTGGAVPVSGGTASSWSCPHPLRLACRNRSTGHLAPAAERTALMTSYKNGRRPAKLEPVATATAAGHRSDGTISSSENLQEVSREIQDGPELGFKPVMSSAAKRPATCCGTPFNPVHS